MSSVEDNHESLERRARPVGGWRRIALRSGLTLAGLAALFGAYVGILILSGNFHEVLPCQLYRSA